jgi:DNA polymerase III alpha subunit
VTDRVRRQLERELRLIEKLKLAGYFLIVWDLIQFPLLSDPLLDPYVPMLKKRSSLSA